MEIASFRLCSCIKIGMKSSSSCSIPICAMCGVGLGFYSISVLPKAQRQTTRHQTNRIPPKFHRVYQKNTIRIRKLPLTPCADVDASNNQPDQSLIYQGDRFHGSVDTSLSAISLNLSTAIFSGFSGRVGFSS